MVVHSLSEENAVRAAAEVEAAGGRPAFAVAGSMDEPGTSEALARMVRTHLGGLDILVNNAGIDNFDPVDAISPQTWAKVLGVNLDGPYLACRALLPLLRERGGAIATWRRRRRWSAVGGCQRTRPPRVPS